MQRQQNSVVEGSMASWPRREEWMMSAPQRCVSAHRYLLFKRWEVQWKLNKLRWDPHHYSAQMWAGPSQAALWSEAELTTFAFLQNDQKLLTDIKPPNFNSVFLHVSLIICISGLLSFLFALLLPRGKLFNLNFEHRLQKHSHWIYRQVMLLIRDEQTDSN